MFYNASLTSRPHEVFKTTFKNSEAARLCTSTCTSTFIFFQLCAIHFEYSHL